jgi:hypothetical protein
MEETNSDRCLTDSQLRERELAHILEDILQSQSSNLDQQRIHRIASAVQASKQALSSHEATHHDRVASVFSQDVLQSSSTQNGSRPTDVFKRPAVISIHDANDELITEGDIIRDDSTQRDAILRSAFTSNKRTKVLPVADVHDLASALSLAMAEKNTPLVMARSAVMRKDVYLVHRYFERLLKDCAWDPDTPRCHTASTTKFSVTSRLAPLHINLATMEAFMMWSNLITTDLQDTDRHSRRLTSTWTAFINKLLRRYNAKLNPSTSYWVICANWALNVFGTYSLSMDGPSPDGDLNVFSDPDDILWEKAKAVAQYQYESPSSSTYTTKSTGSFNNRSFTKRSYSATEHNVWPDDWAHQFNYPPPRSVLICFVCNVRGYITRNCPHHHGWNYNNGHPSRAIKSSQQGSSRRYFSPNKRTASPRHSPKHHSSRTNSGHNSHSSSQHGGESHH